LRPRPSNGHLAEPRSARARIRPSLVCRAALLTPGRLPRGTMQPRGQTTSMRVVHISASDRQGGASWAAWRLHRALRERGLTSHLLVADKGLDDDWVEVLAPTSPLNPVQAQANAVVQHVYRDANRTDLSNTHFSLPLDG